MVGRPPRPLNYVVSMRLTAPAEGEPETADKLTSLLERYPGTRFKLDPTNTWTDELMAELAATGAVDSVDLKGHYKGTPVDVVTDADMYRKVAQAFPDAWIEDPDLTIPRRPRRWRASTTGSPGTRRSTRWLTSRRWLSRPRR